MNLFGMGVIGQVLGLGVNFQIAHSQGKAEQSVGNDAYVNRRKLFKYRKCYNQRFTQGFAVFDLGVCLVIYGETPNPTPISIKEGK
jgi:hypothetical protein